MEGRQVRRTGSAAREQRSDAERTKRGVQHADSRRSSRRSVRGASGEARRRGPRCCGTRSPTSTLAWSLANGASGIACRRRASRCMPPGPMLAPDRNKAPSAKPSPFRVGRTASRRRATIRAAGASSCVRRWQCSRKVKVPANARRGLVGDVVKSIASQMRDRYRQRHSNRPRNSAHHAHVA